VQTELMSRAHAVLGLIEGMIRLQSFVTLKKARVLVIKSGAEESCEREGKGGSLNMHTGDWRRRKYICQTRETAHVYSLFNSIARLTCSSYLSLTTYVHTVHIKDSYMKSNSSIHSRIERRRPRTSGTWFYICTGSYITGGYLVLKFLVVSFSGHVVAARGEEIVETKVVEYLDTNNFS